MEKRRTTDRFAALACTLLAAGIFVIDVKLLPLGVAAGVLYVAVVLIALWFTRPHSLFYVATAVSVLTILGYFWSEPGSILWIVLTNRVLALFAIWTTAIVGFHGADRDVTERKRTEQALREGETETKSILASLSAQIAVVDGSGTILAVNPAWEEFVVDNEGLAGLCNIGANYLDVCRAATGDCADEAPVVARGLQAVLAGTLGEFSIEYPCHSPTQQRWFLLQVTPMRQGEGGAVVSHLDITERVRAEQLLRASEERMRAILHTATDAIITFDRLGIIESVNFSTEQMFGYSTEEVIGQSASQLMPSLHGEAKDGFLSRCLQAGESRIMGVSPNLTGRRKDGSSFPISLAISEVPALDIFTGVVRDISERQKLERDVLGIAEEEQRRIGQDLHDGIQQELAGLGLLTQTLIEVLGTERVNLDEAEASGLRAMATKVINGIARTQREVQNISRGLIPINLDSQGFVDALGELAFRTDELEGVNCAFKCERPVELAGPLIATHLYRIAQEALANAIKHGRPEHVLIALENQNGRLVLQVADDGVGFDPRKRKEGMGLKTMGYRASLIGAVLTVSPVEAGGTLVTCKVLGGATKRD